MEDGSTSDDVPWLDDAQLVEWKSLMAMLTVLPSALDAQLRGDAGVNLFEYHVLVQLADAPERRLPMSSLAFAAQGSPSRLSHAVRRLEAAGWVERAGSCAGRNRVDAILTDAGVAKLVESAPDHVREVRRLVVDAMSAGQLTALGAAARRVLAELDPELADSMGLDVTDS